MVCVPSPIQIPRCCKKRSSGDLGKGWAAHHHHHHRLPTIVLKRRMWRKNQNERARARKCDARACVRSLLPQQVRERERERERERDLFFFCNAKFCFGSFEWDLRESASKLADIFDPVELFLATVHLKSLNSSSKLVWQETKQLKQS